MLSPGLSPGQAAAALPDAESPALALGAHVAAIRETFEEAGILLAEGRDGRPWLPAPGDAEGLAQVRADIGAGRLRFLEWLAARGLRLASAQLLYFAHWVTPEALPKRFDTRFFLAQAPAAAAALHDTREVVSHAWLTPAEALAGAAEGRLRMIEPTAKTLERLVAGESTADIARSLRGRPVPRIMPKLIVDESGRRTLVFPWDPRYETI
jgi:8-oxo-dGTP pyrophosphatase MutT (NUDIX family)